MLAAVERWSSAIAADIDAAVESAIPALEDALRDRSDEAGTGARDDLAALRAERALAEMLPRLASAGAALRLGPPATVGYRLAAWARRVDGAQARRESSGTPTLDSGVIRP